MRSLRLGYCFRGLKSIEKRTTIINTIMNILKGKFKLMRLVLNSLNKNRTMLVFSKLIRKFFGYHFPDMHPKVCADLFNYHQVHVRWLSCRLALQEVGISTISFYYFWSTTY